MKIFIKPLFSLILLLGFFSVNLFAQINLNQPIPIDPNVKVGKLPNGLTYYIQKNSKPEKKMELRLVVNTGSILEDPDQRGLAHFMEHMNFNGSKHFPKNELVDYLQKVGVKFGADLNAYTSFDETVYMLPISSDDPEIVEKGFTVLEDWAFNNLLDKTEIDKERGVVLEESRLSKGAQERMLRQYFPKLFNGSKYAERLPIGKDSILKTFNYATLERFYKQWYRPDLMAVVVVGDIDPTEAEKKIKAHFGGFKNPANAKPRPAITPIAVRTKADAMVVTDDEATNTILEVFNFITPAKKTKTWADYRGSVKKELINALINERLQELTQKENPPFVYGYTGMDQFIRGYDAFISFAVLGDNTTQEAINALLAETEKARKFGFLAAELERSKANMLNAAERAYREKDKSESRTLVSSYVNNYLEGAPIPGPENRYKFLNQILPGISLKEINDEAKKMPAPAHAFALVMAPTKTKDKLPSNSDLEKQIIAAAKQQVKPYEEKAIATNLMEGSDAAGKIVSETKNEKLGTIGLSLSNGVTITMKPTNFKNDEIMMDAWRWGGWQRFPLEDKDNAKHAAELVNVMGVKDMSPTDLQKFLSGKTVEAFPYLNECEEGIEGSSSVKDFETFLQLINLYFTQPRKDESLFNSYVTKQKSTLQFLKANPRYFFQDTLAKIVYNNSPWVTVIPTAQEFENLKLSKIMSIYNQVYGNADGMHFTFVGNVDPVTAKPLFEKYLGSLPGKLEEHKYKDNGVRPVQGAILANIKKGKESQSFINILWSGETQYNREENIAFRALIDALNIKIIEKLREELGGMYSGGLNGSIQKRPYVHYTVSANIPCGPENVDKLTTALFDLIKTAQEKGVDQKDLDKVKETWKKQYKVNLQNNESWLSNLSNSFIDQNNPENILDYEQKIDALTVQDLQKAAQKFLSTTNYIKAVLYPENANVEEGVKRAF
ncbi:MAG TPA: insulinase family protein [Chitinophagaceae bacterium]|nr:insulinase family protein [Chitinophagaceae bacterium]